VHDMAIDSIAQLEAKIQATYSPNTQQREELLALLAELKGQIAELSKTHEEHATSIASFTDISAHEATRQHTNQHLLRIDIEGLSTSVEEFEASHPELVNTVNRISAILSNMGI
jgi:DNA repair exonuclease SbcCD ATPase subunit